MFPVEAIIAEVDKPENRDAVELAAIEFLGWKWMTWLGMPTKSHPLYRDEHTRTVGIPVRTFMSPGMLKHPQWIQFFAKNESHESDMTEPLAYCYCSSGGHAWPGWSPQSDVVADVEKELKKRKLMNAYLEALKTIPLIKGEVRHRPSMRMSLEAALSVAHEKKANGEPESC